MRRPYLARSRGGGGGEGHDGQGMAGWRGDAVCARMRMRTPKYLLYVWMYGAGAHTRHTDIDVNPADNVCTRAQSACTG